MSGISTSCLDHDFRRSRSHEFILNHYWQVRYAHSITSRTYTPHLVIATFCLFSRQGDSLVFRNGDCSVPLGLSLGFTHRVLTTCILELVLGCYSPIVYWNASQSVAVGLNVGFLPYTIANLTYSLSSHLWTAPKPAGHCNFCFASSMGLPYCSSFGSFGAPELRIYVFVNPSWLTGKNCQRISLSLWPFWVCRLASCSQHASSMWGSSEAPEWWFYVDVNSLQLAKTPDR